MKSERRICIEEVERLKAERDALQARIDEGVRVKATWMADINCWEAISVIHHGKHNATLILDKQGEQ